VPSWCHSSIVSSGTLSSAATSSVVKRSDSAPASSPDSGTSTGAIAVGGHDHITGIGRSYGSVDWCSPVPSAKALDAQLTNAIGGHSSM
jgi:hypothetical protein